MSCSWTTHQAIASQCSSQRSLCNQETSKRSHGVAITMAISNLGSRCNPNSKSPRNLSYLGGVCRECGAGLCLPPPLFPPWSHRPGETGLLSAKALILLSDLLSGCCTCRSRLELCRPRRCRSQGVGSSLCAELAHTRELFSLRDFCLCRTVRPSGRVRCISFGNTAASGRELAGVRVLANSRGELLSPVHRP